MATGIEMLGQMGTDQSLAGPVQGGNMVVKPNQVPVGGAAVLAKALRGQADKGVGGMYLLPEQQDQTPDFMKIAQSNVMRDIEGQRNQYPNNYSEAEGGIIPMLPRNLKTAPGADETTLAYITPEEQAILGLLNPGTPHIGPENVPSYDSIDYDKEGNVYVTTGEQASAMENVERGGKVAKSDRDIVKAMSQQHKDVYEKGGYGEDYASQTDAQKEAIARGDGTTTETVDETVSTNQEQFETSIAKAKETLSENEKLLLEQAEAKMAVGDQSGAQSIINSINNAQLNSIFEAAKPKKGDDAETKKKKKTGWGDIFKAFSTGGLVPLIIQEALGGPSKDDVLNKLKSMQTEEGFEGSLTKEEQNVAAGLRLANMDNPGVLTEEQLSMIEAGSGFTSTDKIKEIISNYRGGDKMSFIESMKSIGKGGAIRPDGSISGEGLRKALSTADKRMLKEIDPEIYAKLNFANTSGGHEALGQEQYIDTKKMDRDSDEYKSAEAFNRSVMESREIAGKDRAEQRAMGNIGQRPGSMGGGAGPVIEDEITEAVVEEGATTMPYTGPRTGGVETQVPLQRRFKTDPTQDVAQYTTTPRTQEDIYKYMTQGTTGEGIGLEPFSDYQKRRRKALGLEPLGLWG